MEYVVGIDQSDLEGESRHETKPTERDMHCACGRNPEWSQGVFLRRAVVPMTRRAWLGAAAAAMACGAVRAEAHSYSTPRIVGRTWTPDRDGAGKVRDGNWRNLPLNMWLLAGTAVMNDVIETPHYFGPLKYDGAESIMTNWSGAAFDPINKRILPYGGGHTGTDECETGIYCWDIPSCTYSRLQNRADRSLRTSWNTATNSLDGVSRGAPRSTPILPDRGAFDGAGPYGRPGVSHSRGNLHYLPPEFMGNTSGGIWIGGTVKGIYDLGTRRYQTPYWWNALPGHFYVYENINSVTQSLLDGSSVYAFHDLHYVTRYSLLEKQITDWSLIVGRPSDMRAYPRQFRHSKDWGSGDESTFCHMPEIRQCATLGTYGHVRMRYGQAIDSGLSNWTPYTDPIALTSGDGSHTDLAPEHFASGIYASLALCGVCYDATADCLWVQPNNVGDLLYRIDGISTGNIWTTTKVAGTGALKRMTNGTYGRMRLTTMAGKKILVRLNSIYDPVQVMRIS